MCELGIFDDAEVKQLQGVIVHKKTRNSLHDATFPVIVPAPLESHEIGELYRFTVEQYHVPAESGVLAYGERAELVDGFVVRKDMLTPPRACAVQELGTMFLKTVPDRFRVRIQSAITAGTSEPEPHVMVYRGENPSHRHPSGSEVRLVVEVLGDAPDFDRRKIAVYADAGIENCWIVDVEAAQVEVYSHPDPDTASYSQRQDYSFGESITITLEDETWTMSPLSRFLSDVD